MLNLLLNFYQKFLSPISHFFGKNIFGLQYSCRFTPSCSQYTKIAINRYGPIHGSLLGLKRFLKCNPFFPGGHDPVPDKI